MCWHFFVLNNIYVKQPINNKMKALELRKLKITA